MKQLFAFLTLLLFSATVFAQAYNSPESVEFDYANNRWIIANDNAGNILTRSSVTGAVTVFATGLSGPHGVEIVNDTLYVCDGAKIKVYNLTTAALTATVNLGATFLNGITHDNSGNLYATDFTAKKIYRFSIATHHFNVYCTVTTTPNGIIYDQPNNRCVFVNWGASAPIMAVSLADSTISTITATTLGNCDGIAKDGAGNYYVSSWTGNKVTRFTNTFTTPTTVITGLNEPADIFYNTLTDTLGVPNSGTTGGTPAFTNNTTYHYFGAATTGIVSSEAVVLNLSVSPNPVIQTAEINYETPVQSNVKIQLFDVTGQLVKTIVDEDQGTGKHIVTFDKTNLSAGTYFCKMITGNGNKTQKIIIAK